MKISRSQAAHFQALEKTLAKYGPAQDKFQSDRKAHPKPGPSPKPPPAQGHLPGPNPGVVLPTVPGRPKGVTEIEAVITIDKYEGTVHGKNGDHEIALGHITLINAVGNKKVIDTQQVELAMNIKSAKDPQGLPREIPFKPGQQIEVEGEYIPAKQANDHGRAVLHFTHSPGGYVIGPDGTKYQ
jgi:hypothetical protein